MNSVICHRILPRSRLLYQVRNAGYWNKEWKPGPHPKTLEDRIAAAKKYNLLPEEYKPFPQEKGIDEPGDYPDLPAISVVNKNIYYPWDIPDVRRNYGEPLHYNSVWYGEERVDTHVHQKFKYTPLQMFAALFGVCFFFYLVVFWFPFKSYPPVAARHLYKPGVVHYAYDPVD